MIRKNNKHGLSEIVISLIMIVLVLVAISIVWFIVRGILDKGTGQVNLGTGCLEIQISATGVKNATTMEPPAVPPITYNVVVARSAGGNDIGGVKLIFTNDTGDSNYVYAAAGNIAPLETKTVIASGVSIMKASKVEVVPYFTDDSGNEQVCQTSTVYEF